VEADGLALAGTDDDFILAGGHADPFQLITVIEVNGD